MKILYQFSLLYRHRGCQWGLDGGGHRLVFKTRRQLSICLADQGCHFRLFGGKRANYFIPSRHHSSHNRHLHWKAAGRRQTSRLPLRLNQDLIRDKLVTLFTMANKKQNPKKKKKIEKRIIKHKTRKFRNPKIVVNFSSIVEVFIFALFLFALTFAFCVAG